MCGPRGCQGGKPQRRDRLVTGGGPIGALVAQVATLAGAQRVVVTDPIIGRRAALERCGVEAADPDESTGAGVIRRLFGDANVDVSFECAGAEAALDTCLGAVRRGGTVVVVGVFGVRPRTDMVTVQDHELDVRGSLMYTWRDFREAGRLIDERLVTLGPLQTHHVPFHQWREGYRVIGDPSAGAMKVLVDVDR